MPELLRDQHICFVCNKSQSKFRCGRCHSITYCGGECQKKDLKRHKKNCSPVVYKYENDPGLIATMDIKKGDLIYKDRAIMTMVLEQGQMLLASTIEDKIQEQFLQVSEEDSKRFLNLDNPHGRFKMCGAAGPVAQKFKQNLFMIKSRNKEKRVVCNFNLFLAMSSTKSTTDTFQQPNAEPVLVPGNGKAIDVKAVRDIKAGEEITIDSDFDDLCREPIVISGDGKRQGHCLGLYLWDPESNCYKQKSTENVETRENRYLYRASDGYWYVSDEPGVHGGWICSLMWEKDIPYHDWLYCDMETELYLPDDSIKLRFRDLTEDDVSNKINITLMGSIAEKWQHHYGGQFVKTSKFYSGKPVFKNSHGELLYSADSGGWAIGPEIGSLVLKSTSAGLSPTLSGSWKYWDAKGRRFCHTIVGILEIVN